MEPTPDPRPDRLAPADLGLVDLLSSDAPTSRRGMDLDLQVTERAYGRSRAPHADGWHDATVHSMLTPTPLAPTRPARSAASGQAPPVAPPSPPPPPPPRSRGASIPLPRLRDTIRSAADVERSRVVPGRSWALPVGIAVGTALLVLMASPIVAWFATRSARPIESTDAGGQQPEVLMGIPVRHDLNAPTE